MSTLRETILTHPFFAGMSLEHMEIFLTGAREARYASGQLLFREAEAADRLFLIRRGSISLETHVTGEGAALIELLGPGDVFGWSWLFPPFVWHFQARAVEPTEVIVLNGGHLLVAAERDSKFGYELMKRVAQLLIHRLQATRHRLLAMDENAARSNLTEGVAVDQS